MNRRLAAMAALCRRGVIPASLAVWFAALACSATIADCLSWSLIVSARAAEHAQPSAAGQASVATANEPVTELATGAAPALHDTQSDPETASTDPLERLSPEALPQQPAAERMANREPADTKLPVDTTEVLDECFVVTACVDRYLWALYQRAPKEDTIKEEERSKVTVKKKGKMVTVTKTVTRLIDEDFAWKDRKAAEHAGMTLMDYVIGGVDGSFKLRLFHLLYAAEEAGLSPGIASAFRDDYRQSIASGLKAANDRSYHGGSSHGGYGHGLAADIVSIKGATRDQRWTSSEALWKWVDAHGPAFGIGRPYLDRDPAHMAPIDGREYADHRLGAKVRQAGRPSNARHGVAARNHKAAKHAKTGTASKPSAT